MTNETLVNMTMQAFRALPKYKRRKSGPVKIIREKIKKNTPITLISMREAYLSGFTQRPVQFTISDEDMPIYKLLSEEHGTWMSTLPQELRQMIPVIRKAEGKVLIGGLGLGAIAHLIASKPEVDEVCVVELSQDVINLTKGLLNKKVWTIQMDVFKFPTDKKWDLIFLDIWQSTGEFTWTGTVVPLKRKFMGCSKQILCWQEDEMSSQVMGGLPRGAYIKETELLPPHYRVFGIVAKKKIGVKPFASARTCTPVDWLKMEEDFKASKPLNDLATIFTTKVGTSAWEKMFGKIWDEEFAKEES